MAISQGLSDDTFAQLRNEFVDWINGELDALENIIETLAKGEESTDENSESPTIQLMRMVHNIKGSGGAFGFTTVTTVAHRFEDFLSATTFNLESEEYYESILRFVDQMRALAELGDEPKADVAKAMLRSLPVAGEFTDENSSLAEPTETKSQNSLEALIISPSKTISAISRKVFESLGHRVVGAKTGMEGLGLAVNMHPDFVVMSTVIGGVSGPDMARALSAMHSTRKIKLILISNLDKSHADLNDIPANVDIIHQAGQFPLTLFQHIRTLSQELEDDK